MLFDSYRHVSHIGIRFSREFRNMGKNMSLESQHTLAPQIGHCWIPIIYTAVNDFGFVFKVVLSCLSIGDALSSVIVYGHKMSNQF